VFPAKDTWLNSERERGRLRTGRPKDSHESAFAGSGGRKKKEPKAHREMGLGGGLWVDGLISRAEKPVGFSIER